MDLAHTLIRSVARAFYGAEHSLILDAILLHSALRDDDLAFVMGSQTKHTRKLCYKLQEEGILHKESRPEIRQGANRATNRDYYFINLHAAIDSIKWRIASMQRKIAQKYAQTDEERKDWVCPQCKSEFTPYDVLDRVDFEGNFTCRRCGHALDMIRTEQKESAGHAVQSKLNEQLQPFEQLLKDIDEAEIPENDFNYALAHRKDVKRDDIDTRVRFEPVLGRYAPADTQGLKIEEEKISIDLHDSKQTQELENAQKAERAKKLADQNLLPAWHTHSTVTSDVTELGRREQQQRSERDREIDFLNDAVDAKDRKLATGRVEESDTMKDYLAALRAEEEQARAIGPQEDESGSEEEESDDDFEDVGLESEPIAKKVKTDEPPTNGQLSGATERSAETNNVSSTVVDAPTKIETNGTSPVNGTSQQEEVDSDEDDLDFQDV